MAIWVSSPCTGTDWKPGGGPTQFRGDQRSSGGGKSKRSGAQFFARPLCSSGTYGYGANAGTAHRRPRSHGRWCGASFFKEILKALLHSAGAGYGHRSPNPNGASARGGLEKRRAYPLPVAKPGVCHNLTRGMAGGFTAIQRLEFYSHSYQQLNIVLKHRSGSHCYRVS